MQKFRKRSRKMGKMIETYFETRQELRGVISLVDARHEPTELDCQMINFYIVQLADLGRWN